jgi:hypothetical protein
MTPYSYSSEDGGRLRNQDRPGLGIIQVDVLAGNQQDRLDINGWGDDVTP